MRSPLRPSKTSNQPYHRDVRPWTPRVHPISAFQSSNVPTPVPSPLAFDVRLPLPSMSASSFDARLLLRCLPPLAFDACLLLPSMSASSFDVFSTTHLGDQQSQGIQLRCLPGLDIENWEGRLIEEKEGAGHPVQVSAGARQQEQRRGRWEVGGEEGWKERSSHPPRVSARARQQESGEKM